MKKRNGSKPGAAGAGEQPSSEQRLHDLRAIHADFNSVIRLVRGGYRFDDDDAPAALAQLEKAVGQLKEEIGRLEREWG